MNTHDRGGTVAGVGLVFLVWARITVCLRYYVRIYIVKAFGIVDFVMTGALVSAIVLVSYPSTTNLPKSLPTRLTVLTVFPKLSFTVFGIVSTVGTRYGTGRHMNELEPHHIKVALLVRHICYLSSIAFPFIHICIALHPCQDRAD